MRENITWKFNVNCVLSRFYLPGTVLNSWVWYIWKKLHIVCDKCYYGNKLADKIHSNGGEGGV